MEKQVEQTGRNVMETGSIEVYVCRGLHDLKRVWGTLYSTCVRVTRYQI